MASGFDKGLFFAALDALDDEGDDEVDSQTHQARESVKRQKSDHLGDTKIEALGEKQHLVKSLNPGRTSSTNLSHVRSMTRPVSPSLDVGAAESTTISIRSAGANVVQPTSTAALLFRNHVFYFIPNNDVAKPRKLRIQSAVAHGAVWSRSINSKVSHIIVDCDVNAASVAKLVQLKAVDLHQDLSIVNSTWLIECLCHKTLRDPAQRRFQLKGAALAFRHLCRAESMPNSVASADPSSPVVHSSLKCNNQSPNGPDDSSPDALWPIIKTVREVMEFGCEDSDISRLLSFSSFDDAIADEGDHDVVPHHANTGFQCMVMKNRGSAYSGPNANTVQVLQKMASYYDHTGDQWRVLGYRRAIMALKMQDTLVATAEQARAIRGIGFRLAEKIEEIVTTSRLRRLDSTITDSSDRALHLFMGIYGVGCKQARTWISQGHRTLDDLQTKADLTTNQKIGVDHYHDFLQKIPRAEVEKHAAIVQSALTALDPKLTAIIGGSYRRGNDNCGDIDLLITSADPQVTIDYIRDKVMTAAIPVLSEVGFLKCALVCSYISSLAMPNDNHTSKWHGVSALPREHGGSDPPWRRIDLLFTPPSELGAALLYFTGNDIFNRSMRLLASKKNMRLNQRGLFADVMRGKGRVKVTQGRLIEGTNERRIFEILGVPWREPWERQC